MSGHSKWATTKRAKAIVDAKRSSLFTKLSKNIAVAARAGIDPDTNFKLRIAIDKARALNMPKDNIERAIKRGSGEGGGQIESLLYEGFGPGGVALVIEVLTDNKNRAVSNLKHILTKHGGSFASEGSVRWMFDVKGQIFLKQDKLSEDEELKIIEAGAEDIITDDGVKIITSFDGLEKVKNNLQDQGFAIDSSEIAYIAKDKIKSENLEQLIELLDELDDDDDVNNIYTNTDV